MFSLFLAFFAAMLRGCEMEKLLLIDDEADVQYSFRRIFDSPEMQIETASSGEEGLKLIPRFQPDLVMMDVRMGGISGLETLRRLRQSDAKLPVIIMTAYGTTQTAIIAACHHHDRLRHDTDGDRGHEIGRLRLRAQTVRRAEAQSSCGQCAGSVPGHEKGGQLRTAARIRRLRHRDYRTH